MARKRLPEEVRKSQILDAALTEAQECGYQWITRDAIAVRAGVSTGLVTRHWSTMIQLKRAVLRAAIDREVLPIIAQGLADKNPHTANIPDALKARALATLR